MSGLMNQIAESKGEQSSYWNPITQIWHVTCYMGSPVMLVLGLRLKAKFCGLGLTIGWPWDCGLGHRGKFKAKILADYKIDH